MPFRRMTEDESTAQSSGLGLVITDSAITLHGGAIEGENAVDGGLMIQTAVPV